MSFYHQRVIAPPALDGRHHARLEQHPESNQLQSSHEKRKGLHQITRRKRHAIRRCRRHALFALAYVPVATHVKSGVCASEERHRKFGREWGVASTAQTARLSQIVLTLG